MCCAVARDPKGKEDAAAVVHSRTLSVSTDLSTTVDAPGSDVNRSALERADTLPGGPAARLDDDEDHKLLVAHVAEARAFLAARAWDNLAHIERFVVGAALASRVSGRFDDAGTRRHLVGLLWPLLPAPMRTPSSGGHPWHTLPARVAERAPHFSIQPGDVPRIAPSYSAFLADLDVESLFVAARTADTPPFLAPRSVCPGAARGSCAAVFLEERISAIPTSLPPTAAMPGVQGATWRCAAVRSLDGGERVRVRTGTDGKPMRTVDGREEPITLTTDMLAAWLLSAGPDARGLDLRSDDDRALLLTWAHALREKRLQFGMHDASVFELLEDDRAPASLRARVVEAAIACAIDVVARYAVDPLAVRFALRGSEGDGGWTEKAAAALDACALFHDVTPRTRSSAAPTGAATNGARTTHARDIVWLDALLRPGFACGRLTSLSAGRAFARLATSVLAPLGVLPSSGLKDGTGAVLLQRLVDANDADGRGRYVERAMPRLISFTPEAPVDSRVIDEPLFGAQGAWAHGRGHALADPRGSPRHDVTAMPAWLAFFLEGLS